MGWVIRVITQLWFNKGEASAHWTGVTQLYLRVLALIYLSAFISFAFQFKALIGSHGILPAGELLDYIARQTGQWRFIEFPTLAWISSSDYFLQGIVYSGIVCSVLLLFGLSPLISTILLWALYLSLVNVGSTFMQYQWESLLLEAGFLSIFLCSKGLWKAGIKGPSGLVVLLFRFLAFRLIFSSGIAKLVSGDPRWSDLTALSFHYETQPLPTAFAWYMHQLPMGFHKMSTCLTLLVECLCPILFFCGRRCRIFAFYLQTFFQILILLTGNYTYFNFLSMGIFLFLLDDDHLRLWRLKKMRVQKRQSL